MKSVQQYVDLLTTDQKNQLLCNLIESWRDGEINVLAWQGPTDVNVEKIHDILEEVFDNAR